MLTTNLIIFKSLINSNQLYSRTIFTSILYHIYHIYDTYIVYSIILWIAFCFSFFSTSPFFYQHDLAPCHLSFTNKILKSSCVIWESSPRERICPFSIMYLCSRCTQKTWINHQFSFVLATLFEWLVGTVGLYIFFKIEAIRVVRKGFHPLSYQIPEPDILPRLRKSVWYLHLFI